MAPFIDPFFRVLLIILDLLQWLVLIWVILSWILFFARQSSFRWRHRGFFNVLEQLNDIFARMTHPFLRPFRRLLRNVNTAGIDWSPLLLILAIILLRGLVAAIYRSILIG
ncbi:MAG TPA: YggT family protein [Thermoanaerobaculia bacterium]|nr:YggT family protein [Thermoanaerobaculia bacterium]